MAAKDLRVVYSADAGALKRTLGEIDQAHATLATKLHATGQKISSAGVSMVKSFTVPIVAGFAVAINEATEFAQVQGQTIAALKSTGGAAGVTAQHVVALSDKIGKLSAQDGELVQAGENILLTFTNIRNEVGKGNSIFDRSSIAAANLSTRMGTDLKSAMTLVGKAVNDPIKGLTALTRVGVTFTDKQKTMIQRMVESGNTMGAQKVILAELGKEFGGSAKAAGDAASPFTKLKLAGLDIAQSIGTVILPAVQKFTTFIGGLADKFQALSPGAKQAIVTFAAIAAAVGPVILVVGKLVSAIGTISTAIGAVSKVLSANPYIALIAVTIALVTLIVTHWDRIKEILTNAWNKIKEVASTVWHAIKTALVAVWTAIKTAIETYVGFYKEIFHRAWDAIKTVAATAWGLIKTVIINPLTTIKEKIGDALGWIRDKWHTIWNGLKEVASNVWDGIVSAARTALNVIIGLINGLIIGWNAMIRAFNKIPFVPDLGTIEHIPTLAKGGIVRKPTLAMIGEAGPEAVVPLSGAGANVGGDTYHFHLQGVFVGADQDRFAEWIHDALLIRQRRNGTLGLNR